MSKEPSCTGCINGWPIKNGVHEWRSVKTPCRSFVWPQKLTIVRYDDGGFSATTAEPPDGIQFAKTYYADDAAFQRGAAAMKQACVEEAASTLPQLNELSSVEQEILGAAIATALAFVEVKEKQ